MHNSVKNLLEVQNNINLHLKELKINGYPKIIADYKLIK